MSDETKLHRCPCGAEVSFVRAGETYLDCVVRCPKCHTTGPVFETHEEAEAWWSENVRDPDAPPTYTGLADVLKKDPLGQWWNGSDTGISSCTIAHVLGGVPFVWRDHPSTPADEWDLLRCIRLLDIMPGWRERLPEVAERYPEWAPIVAAWDELERATREETRLAWSMVDELLAQAAAEEATR